MRATNELPKNTASEQMQAIVQDTYGSADVLELTTVDRPALGDDEVLIEVIAAGLDRGVEHLMTGLPYLIRVSGFGLTKPKNRIPGLDVAGRVVAVGGEVTRFVPGDEVFGIANGSYAEYTIASEKKLAHKPANVTFEQAAVAAISGITALQALTKVGNLQPGQKVLVLGASGGVGSYAVQLAKTLGGVVTGVASKSKLELVRSLGADQVIDYTEDDFVDTAARYDLIIDTGGRNSISRLRSVLASKGRLVIVGGEGGGSWTGGVGRQLRAMMLSLFTRQRLGSFISKEHFDFIEQLADHMAQDQVVPAIGQRFNLDQVPEAIRQMGAGQLSGKAAIIVDEDVAGLVSG